MGDKTKIEWADATWNPVIGCERISAGCQNCYAEKMARRLAVMGADGYDEVVRFSGEDGSYLPMWNGETAFVESAFDKPLRWKKPRRIFVCSMGDLFHESVDFYWQAQVLSVIAECQHHTFMVLTKRPHIMADFFSRHEVLGYCPNLWLGVTAETQQAADERIPILLQIPAAVRFVSVEPMIGPVDLPWVNHGLLDPKYYNKLDWVICGGESGPGARPLHPDWVRGLRDQCVGAGVPFMFKQWGEWIELSQNEECRSGMFFGKTMEAEQFSVPNQCKRITLCRLGKKKAGRLLDGETWDQFPG